jgi:heat-inducible transcriptional repressor
MPSSLKLNSRQQHVLWATVRQYVATAEPVGSRKLAQEYNFRVSPATVRNAMGSLEKSGFLYQPHTSAGRIPSDSGYRLYVDHLMQPSMNLSEQVSALFTEELDWQRWSLEALLKGATQILSTLSGYLALITVPQANVASIRHLQLVQLESNQILMVVLLESLGTQSLVIQLPGPSSQEEEDIGRILEILSNFLTSHLRGQQLGDVANLDWSDLDDEFRCYTDGLQRAVLELACRLRAPTPTQLMISGLAEVLRQPEFSATHQIQSILQILEEEHSQLWPLFFESPTPGLGDQKVRIWIGSENPLIPMQACALVSSTYSKDSVPLGSVGILGPTRMMYENAVAVVEAAAQYLSSALTQPDSLACN